MEEIIDISTGLPEPLPTKMGRPSAAISKTFITQQIRKKTAEIVLEEAEPIIRAQVKAAIGGYTTLTTFRDKNGVVDKTVESEETPNVNAAKLLFETTIGKPKETVKHEGGIGIVALVARLEKGDNDDQAEDGAD